MKSLNVKKGLILISVLCVSVLALSGNCWSADSDDLLAEIRALQEKTAELDTLKTRLSELETRLATESDLEEKADARAVKFSGVIRYNYAYNDFTESDKDKKGDMGFDLFRIGVDGEYDDLFYSAQYRWNSYQDFIHHAYIGYNFDETLSAQLGVTAVPFANAYETHNFWAGIPYFIGLADDFDMGLKVIKKSGPWDFQFAFFKNGEWGSAGKTERYSYDIINDGTQSNEETNQFNGRVAYTFDHGDLGKTEVGFSAQWGQLYNNTTEDMGDHRAFAVHLDGYYGPFNLRFEAVDYEYNAENPAGVDDKVVRIGAFSDSFDVAAEGTVYAAGLSYDVPVSWGPISKLTFYDDYSILVKDESDFEDSHINTVGCMVTAGPVYTYIDVISGKNAAYLGGNSDTAFGAGDEDADWGTKFNINIAYYF